MVDQGPSPSPPSDEKPFAAKSTIFTIGFLIGVLGLVPALFSLLDLWISISLPNWVVVNQFWRPWLSLVGISIFTIGLAAYVFCSIWLIFFGRSPHVEFDPPKFFVATGPYRWVRNPVVICLLVTALGEAIYFRSTGIFIFFFLGLVFAQYQVTQIEEPRLRLRFGQTYEDYCRRVSRWIPRPPNE